MTMPQVANAPAKPDSPVDRGLQRLAGAVLIQALPDASSGPRRFREEALEWINGKTTSGFSFEFCCALLGREPEDVRERLRKKNFIPKFEPESDTSMPGYNGSYPSSNGYGTQTSQGYISFAAKSASA